MACFSFRLSAGHTPPGSVPSRRSETVGFIGTAEPPRPNGPRSPRGSLAHGLDILLQEGEVLIVGVHLHCLFQQRQGLFLLAMATPRTASVPQINARHLSFMTDAFEPRGSGTGPARESLRMARRAPLGGKTTGQAHRADANKTDASWEKRGEFLRRHQRKMARNPNPPGLRATASEIVKASSSYFSTNTTRAWVSRLDF